MTWLVTGGAGYIGGHLVDTLVGAGRPVVVLDDLSTGRAERLDPAVELVRGDVADRGLVRRVLTEHSVSGVLHLAASKSVPESVDEPLAYYGVNVEGTRAVLEAMRDAGVRRLVYSSSAAVYGTGYETVVSEDLPPRPESPYARTKLVGEWLVRDCATAWGLSGVCLRYFNVAGARRTALADRGATNLVPRVVDALSGGGGPQVYGTDWPSPDGTCIRDYIHVDDLVDAHVLAMERTGHLEGCCETYNVGLGRGASVLEVITELERVAGTTGEKRLLDRRPGDPFMVVADASAITRRLGWRPRRDLADIARDSWATRPTAGDHAQEKVVGAP